MNEYNCIEENPPRDAMMNPKKWNLTFSPCAF